MKKINFKIAVTSTVFCMMLLVSCSDFVEVGLPPSQLTSQTVFEDPTTANAAIGSIYAGMRDAGLFSGNLGGLSNSMGLYADELDYYRQDINYLYQNALFASQSDVKFYWNQGYGFIFSANAVIQGVTNAQALTPADRNRMLGEALFIRAFVHFYLNEIYGGVPYVTTTDYTVNRSLGRLGYQEALLKVREDLSNAITLFDGNGMPSGRTRPGKTAAMALLARASLYAGLWEEASSYASAVISDPDMQWVDDLSQVFLKDSPATIWQFSPATSAFNTLEADLFIFESGPPPTMAITASLIAAFESGDQRRSLWVREVTAGTSVWYHPYKYKLRTGSGSQMEHSIVLRLSEQFLIRAEARAHLGDVVGGLEDLNKIRTTVGLPVATAQDQQELVAKIIKERRVEFFTEFGHRFFDLKRTGQLDSALQGLKPGWNSTDALFPIPADELSLNPNLSPQNPGY
ncbi:RagB/SusD family nutrient uptake outer membrane protein [Flavobacterium sp. RHBU_3]|uniref:RagB/SusD family nutrient uptake outer membrane protein n=1 Tax=Flavobacterium sp. RHBU_3 TaxID=3391184 RepID=UPI003984C960